eukprot:6727269-Pyramimonas_sp.AAC.1
MQGRKITEEGREGRRNGRFARSVDEMRLVGRRVTSREVDEIHGHWDAAKAFQAFQVYVGGTWISTKRRRGLRDVD